MNSMEPTSQPAGTALIDPTKQAQLLSALYAAQKEHGYLNDVAMRQVAQRLGLPLGQIYSTASFYTLLHTEPIGRYVVQVCRGLSCYLNNGAERMADYVTAKLGIQPGETTADGRFTLETVECLAACDLAPVMRINDQLYGNLTPDKVDAILKRLMEEE